MKNINKYKYILTVLSFPFYTGVDLSAQVCVSCSTALITGHQASGIGFGTEASGDFSLAMGFGSRAVSLRSVALGNMAVSSGWSALAIGNLVKASANNAFVIGTGYSNSQLLQNQVPNSLMVGFNSDLPTLFIEGAGGPGQSGRVGIGTTSPGEMLSVAGIVESRTGGFRFPDGTVQQTKAFTPWLAGTNNRISFSGDVGVGTTTPVGKLDVYGDIVLGKPGDNFILHSRPWVGDALIIAPQNGGGGWDWSKSLTLKDNGQVFIGGELAMASPHVGYKLAVNGKIVSKEVVVTIQQWADEVFHPEYRLPSLQDVEKYIFENRHLPGVPSASDVAADGLTLGEMNRILLTKVEELTLYAINISKELAELRSVKGCNQVNK